MPTTATAASQYPGGGLFDYADVRTGSTQPYAPRYRKVKGATYGPGELDPTGFLGGDLDVGGRIFGEFFGDSQESTLKPWQKLANREWAQGNAVLSAYERLYSPTLALAQRSATDYGDLWRRGSNEQLAHDVLSATTRRGADVADYAKLGPEYIAAQRSSNPLLAKLYDAAQADLDLGYDLDPETLRMIEESVRSAQAARGMGRGPSDVFDEAVTKAAFGDQYRRGLRTERMDRAGRAAGMFGDVFQATTGRPAASPAPVGAEIQAPDYPGFNEGLFSYGVNREIQGRNLKSAQGAARMGMWGQIIGGALGAAGSVGGAYMGGG
jgi:hypothetical protein